jgi:hypothetical protein
MQVSTVGLGTLFLFTAIVVAWAGVSIVRYKQRRNREKMLLESVGREICAEFHQQLIAIVPSIFRRPSAVFPSVDVLPKESRFRPRPLGVTLTVKLTAKKDFRTVQLMLQEFLEEYLSRPGNRRYRVKTFFPPVFSPSTSEEKDRS